MINERGVPLFFLILCEGVIEPDSNIQRKRRSTVSRDSLDKMHFSPTDRLNGSTLYYLINNCVLCFPELSTYRFVETTSI